MLPTRALLFAAGLASLAVACGSTDDSPNRADDGTGATSGSGTGGAGSTGSGAGASTGSGGVTVPEMGSFVQRFSQSDRETAEALTVLPDGVVVVGKTAPGADAEAWIMKLDTDGNVAWDHLVGGPSGEGYTDVTVDPDGNIVAVGDVGIGLGAGFIHRFSPQGDLLDQRVIGTGDDGESLDAIVAHDGGYYVAGSVSGASSDAFLARLDDSLDVVWQQTLSGSGADNFFALAPLPAGGVVATGSSMGADLDIDAIVTAVGPEAQIQWTKIWGADEIDQAWAVTPTDNAIFVGGRTSSYGLGDADGLLMRITFSGELLWAQTIGTADTELVYDVEVDGAGNLVFSGRSGDFDLSHGWLGGFDVDTGSATFGTRITPEGYQVFDGVRVVGNRLVAAGFTEVDDDDGDSDFIVVSTDLQGQIDGGCTTVQSSPPTVGEALGDLADADLTWNGHNAPVQVSSMAISASAGMPSSGCN